MATATEHNSFLLGKRPHRLFKIETPKIKRFIKKKGFIFSLGFYKYLLKLRLLEYSYWYLFKPRILRSLYYLQIGKPLHRICNIGEIITTETVNKALGEPLFIGGDRTRCDEVSAVVAQELRRK